jgi:DNA-binding GntR family transcriptional regulator
MVKDSTSDRSMSQTQRDKIINRLRHEIVSNKLEPGTIIKDAELARQLGTSITPVREALSRLAAEGLVDMPPNRAKRVATLSRQSGVELCEAMQLLSIALFERGARRLTRTDLLLMRDALQEFQTAKANNDIVMMLETGRAFTDVVIRAGGNLEIRRMLAMILARFQRLLTICFREGLLDDGLETNSAIFTALESGNPDEAVRLYQEQMQSFQHSIEQLPVRIWTE